jgi:hypothetical protein
MTVHPPFPSQVADGWQSPSGVQEYAVPMQFPSPSQ